MTAAAALACLKAGDLAEARAHLDAGLAAGDDSLAAAKALLLGGWPDFAAMVLEEQVEAQTRARGPAGAPEPVLEPGGTTTPGEAAEGPGDPLHGWI